MSDLMDDLRESLKRDQMRVTVALAFGPEGSRQGLVLETKNYSDSRWVKHPVAIYPSTHAGQTLSDVFTMLLDIQKEVRA